MERKIFLYGKYRDNKGPENVNRAIVNLNDPNVFYCRFEGKIGRLIEMLIYIRRCDAVVISGMCTRRSLNVIKKLSRNVNYLMHGCLEYENIINDENLDEDLLSLEKELLKNSRKIVCVSKTYAHWVANRYPEYSDKVFFAYNGLDVREREKRRKEEFSIAVAGGDRKIKKNDIICEVIKTLRQRGIECKLYIFGDVKDKKFGNDVNATLMGQMNKDEYYRKLDEIEIFVVNSELEPFGLVVGDALACHCSLLLSNSVGASDSVAPLGSNDMIYDNDNVDEIADKIIRLFRNGNSDRLVNNLRNNNFTSKRMISDIRDICCNVDI